MLGIEEDVSAPETFHDFLPAYEAAFFFYQQRE